MRVFFIIFFTLIYSTLYSQDENLSKNRKLYCVKDCKKYKYEQDWIKNKKPPGLANVGRYPKFKRIFSIPLKIRNEIYPFNRYDSIYVASPNYINKKEEQRDYLNKKFHHSIRQISLNERDKLSDILFNYYELNVIYKTGLFSPEDEDHCIQSRYPKILLLFKKNGKFEKYIAFPDEGFTRYNFSEEEYQNFDWSEKKERMILDLFKNDILPEEKCKK